MKRFVFLAVVPVFLLAGCKYKDTKGPLIFLKGSNPMTVTLNTPWVDPGATADDNVDGTMDASSIKVTTTIPLYLDNGIQKTKTTGDYTVTYSCTDKAGNTTTVTRNVTIQNSAWRFATNYSDSITANNHQIIPVDTTILNIAITTDLRSDHIVWFSKLGGRVNLLHTPYPSTVRAKAFFTNYVDESLNKQLIFIPLQRIILVEGTTAADSFIYTVVGKLNSSYVIDSISPRFVLNYTIQKYRKASNGIFDTLGHKWDPFRTDEVREEWISY